MARRYIKWYDMIDPIQVKKYIFLQDIMLLDIEKENIMFGKKSKSNGC